MIRLIILFYVFFAYHRGVAQFELFDPKGKTKVRVETTTYHAHDSTLSVHVLNYNKQGHLTKAIKYDQANEALETHVYSYKYRKGGQIKSQSGSFKDHTKTLKGYKFKAEFTYDKNGRLGKMENIKTGKGYELVYDSIGQLKEKSDFSSKGFYSGSSFKSKNGRIDHEKFVLSGKAAEFTEYFYDSEGKLLKTLRYRAKVLVERRIFTYLN